MRRGAFSSTCAALVLAGSLGACAHSASTGAGARPTTTTAPAELLVAFGSTAGYGTGLTDRLRDSWPQLLLRESFPLSTVFVNLSDDPTTIDRAVLSELPVALEQHAQIAAIWLGPGGEGVCGASTTASQYEPALTSLVAPLRAAGTRVLIGNVPDGVGCAIAFNAAVTNVAHAQHATVADVASALATTPTVGPSSGINLSESRAIASAFAAALATT